MPGTTGRVLGLETEYGIVAAHTLPRAPGTPNPLTAAEAVAELYRGTPQEFRSRNRFLPNGGRLYVDLGSHPEYATAECRTVSDVVAQDRAGEQILRGMAERANASLAEREIPARIHVLKNNMDSSGSTFGCHENYQVARETAENPNPGLIAFLATRPVITGGGHVSRASQANGSAGGFTLSARAPFIHRVISPDPTRERPMIVTRDEPLADPTRHARLQVTHGDSNVTDTTTFLKLGLTGAVLDLVEEGGRLDDLALEDPVRALRALAVHGPTASVALADGRRFTVLGLQEAVLERCEARRAVGLGEAAGSRDLDAALALARRAVDALRAGDTAAVGRELDWVVKRALLERYLERAGTDWDNPLAQRVELAYHDISATHGLAEGLRTAGLMGSSVSAEQVSHSVTAPPADTRAAVRGAFVAAVEEYGMQASVGWTHVRLDSPPRPQIDLLDALVAQDDAVDALLEEMRTSLPHHPGGRSGLGWLRLGLGNLG